MGDKFYVRSFAASGACTGELEEWLSKLRILGVGLDVNEILLGGNFLNAIFPVVGFAELSFKWNHCKSLFAFLAWADIGAVAAAETVENINLLNIVHAFHCFRSKHVKSFALEILNFFVCHYERTDGSVRTAEGTLVALDTVVGIPNGNESCYATFFVSCCALFPSTVDRGFVSRNREKISVLCIDGTHELGNVFRFVALDFCIVGKISPLRVNGKLFVLATTLNSLEVLVNNILTFLSVALNNEFLHLLYGKINRNYLCNAEECRLENGIRPVAETNFLSNLCGIDIINGYVVLRKITFDMVRQIVCQVLRLPRLC